MKSMVGKFVIEKARGAPASSGVLTTPQVDEPQTPEEEEDMLKFPYREAVGALIHTATMTRPDIACAVRAMARFWDPVPVQY